jgi:hypothetical protein
MSRIHLEELESRLLLTSLSTIAGVPLFQSSMTSADLSAQGGHVDLASTAGGGGAMGQARSPEMDSVVTGTPGNSNPGVWSNGPAGQIQVIVPNTIFVVITDNSEPIRWNSAEIVQPPVTITFWEGVGQNIDPRVRSSDGTQNNGYFNVIPAPMAATTNPGSGQFVSPGSANGINAAPVEHTQTTFALAGANPPLESGTMILTTFPEFPTHLAGYSASLSSFLSASIGVGILYDSNGFQLPSLFSFLGSSPSSESARQSGTPAQGLSIPPSPSNGSATAPFFSEPQALDQHTIIPKLFPPFELVPQSQGEASLPPSNLSAFKAGLRQFLAVLGPQSQKAASLPTPDLSVLEAGLLQFLGELGEISSPLAVTGGGAALRLWMFAAAGAGAACAIAYRQQRRFRRAFASDYPQLPGCAPDDLF